MDAKREAYLFKIAKATLNYFGIEPIPERLADLVMMDLANIKE